MLESWHQISPIARSECLIEGAEGIDCPIKREVIYDALPGLLTSPHAVRKGKSSHRGEGLSQSRRCLSGD